MAIYIDWLIHIYPPLTSCSVRRVFERGGGGGGGGRKFRKYENNKDQNENFPAQNQARFPAQN